MKNLKSTSFFSYSILFMGVLFLSISPLFVRWIDAPGIVTSFYRMMTVVLVASMILFLQRKQVTRHKYSAKIWLLPVLGGLFSAVDHALWSTSIENTFVANATLLNYIAPLWVSLIAILLLKERYSPIFWLGLLMVLWGAWIVTGAKIGDFSNFSLAGEGFASLSSFFYAGYFLISQKAGEYFRVLSYLLISSAAAVLALLIIILFSGYAVIGYTRETYLLFLVAGLFSQLGGYFSINYALGHISAPIVSAVLILQPVMTSLLAVWFEHENISLSQVLGGVLVLTGVVIVKLAKQKKQSNSQTSAP